MKIEDAISKLAILENMIEDGDLVAVVRCKDCKHSQLEDQNRVYCTIKGQLSNKKSFCEAMERSERIGSTGSETWQDLRIKET